MSSSSSSIPLRFQNVSLYDLFHVTSTSTSSEISKAYRKLALKFHPDHNHNNPHANEEFAYINKLYNILSDPQKKAYYDETGKLFDENDLESNTHNGNNPDIDWRNVYPAINEEDIENFRLEYVNSEDEFNDISQAFELYDGDLDSIFQSVPFANADNIDRIVAILNDRLDAKYNKKEIEKFRKEWTKFEQSEAAEAEQMKQELLTQSELKLLKDEETNNNKKKSKNNKNNKDNDKSTESALTQIIKQRNAARAQQMNQLFDNLENKYAALDEKEQEAKTKTKSKKTIEDNDNNNNNNSVVPVNKKKKGPSLSDEDFEKFQAQLFAKKDSNTNTNNKSSKKTKEATKKQKIKQ